jgi:CHASE3 domain sensor protein
MNSKSPQKSAVRLAFGFAIAALLVVGALAYRSMIVSNENVRWVRHTHEVLENLQDLHFAMENIAGSVRGFVLTGKESYLEHYRADILSVEQHATAVLNLTVDNPEQQRKILALEKLADERIKRAETNISLRRTQGLDSTADAIRDGSGLQATADFQEIVNQIQNEEQQLLLARNAVADWSVSETKVILVVGIFAGLLITIAAGWNVLLDNTRRGAAERALRDSEDKYRGLAQGVQDYAILMLGPRGEVRSWNRGAENMSGYTFEDVHGHHFSCFFPAEDIELGKPEEILRMAATNGLHEVQR